MDHFKCPDLGELKKFRIIVTTSQTARTLRLKNLKPGHFTHIFIDEAAQVRKMYSYIRTCACN